MKKRSVSTFALLFLACVVVAGPQCALASLNSFQDEDGSLADQNPYSKFEVDQDVDTHASGYHEIPNAFYFKKLRKRYAPNAGDTCSVVATEILIGYLATFNDCNAVSSQYLLISKEETGNQRGIECF